MKNDGLILKAIIADDESLARNIVRKYLNDFQNIKIIAECANGLLTLNKINELKPDLVFLDIQMPEMDGLSLLKEVVHFPFIIFTTAYNQYAIKAFEVSAVDYLLKPFTRDRFAQAVKKVTESKNTPASLERKVNHLQHSLNELLAGDKKFVSRLLIKSREGHILVNVQDVLWMESDGDYVKLHTKEKVYLKTIRMNELEAKLNPQQFIRIHRSTVVNISFIRDMKPYFNGEYHIYLTNGEKLKLSRNYKEKIKVIAEGTL